MVLQVWCIVYITYLLTYLLIHLVLNVISHTNMTYISENTYIKFC